LEDLLPEMDAMEEEEDENEPRDGPYGDNEEVPKDEEDPEDDWRAEKHIHMDDSWCDVDEENDGPCTLALFGAIRLWDAVRS
jgi:hypothetical protein